MMIKVSEATDDQLNWLVAKCMEHQWRCSWMLEKDGFWSWHSYEQAWGNPTPEYTTDWAQGGPIIDRMVADGYSIQRGEFDTGVKVMRFKGGDIECQFGPTPLIAAMRCFVVSKLGDEVEIPNELLFINKEST